MALFTKYSGLDPEVNFAGGDQSSRAEFFTLPLAKRVTRGCRSISDAGGWYETQILRPVAASVGCLDNCWGASSGCV